MAWAAGIGSMGYCWWHGLIWAAWAGMGGMGWDGRYGLVWVAWAGLSDMGLQHLKVDSPPENRAITATTMKTA